MSDRGPHGGGNSGRRRRKPKQPPEFWRESVLPDEDLKVIPAADVTAALRSLGPPPLPGQGNQAEQALASVILRAANLAIALAAAADILEMPEA